MKTVKETADVIAVAAHRLMFFLRLALVASLAGYMLPTVSFAMHGDAAANYMQRASSGDVHAAQFSALKASIARDHTDDLRVFAEPIGLNRPPAFRT
jgi:hypothetical protein